MSIILDENTCDERNERKCDITSALGMAQIGSVNETGEGGGAGINDRSPAVRKESRYPRMLQVFLSFSLVSLSVDCTN
jgi:hypothetical protein